MTLDPVLLQILACPKDKGPLYYIEDESILFNPRLALLYRIVDGIPVMLTEEAVRVSDQECARLQQRIASEHIAPSFEAPASRPGGKDGQ